MSTSSRFVEGLVAGASCAVIAHRGASRAARENTLEAFAKARALRADAVELDVRRTADEELVVVHDPAVPGLGPVVEATLAEMAVSAPWIPTLDDALEACAGMGVNVEVKNLPIDPDWDPDERVARRVAAVLTARGAEGRAVVSSFNPAALTAVHEENPALATGLLTVAVVDPLVALAAAAEAGHAALHPHVDALAGDALDRVVIRAREAGLAVVPWTVDDPGEIVRLARGGVAGIITNVPDVARRALEGDGARRE